MTDLWLKAKIFKHYCIIILNIRVCQFNSKYLPHWQCWSFTKWSRHMLQTILLCNWSHSVQVNYKKYTQNFGDVK